MVTLKPVVFSHHRRQDGTYPVKIRLTHNRQVKYIATTLTARPQDLTRSLKIKSPSLMTGCEAVMQDIRTSLAKLSPFALEEMDAGQVVDFIRSDQTRQVWRMDFFAWADSWIAKQSEGARRNYINAVNALERHLGCRSLDINAITMKMLTDLQAELDAENKKGLTSVLYVKSLARIYHQAQERYNDEEQDLMLIPRDPFKRIHGTAAKGQGQPNLGQEFIQRMIDAEITDGRLRLAVDAFLLSFVLYGMNVADLYELEPVKDGWLVYERRKTRTRRDDRAEMRIRVTPVQERYLARLKGIRHTTLLPERWRSSGRATHCLNEWLKEWCESEGVQPFTMYAARHTFASVARNRAGLSKDDVDELLVHKGDYDLADIYIERDWDYINTQGEKVLDLFRWHD